MPLAFGQPRNKLSFVRSLQRPAPGFGIGGADALVRGTPWAPTPGRALVSNIPVFHRPQQITLEKPPDSTYYRDCADLAL